MSALAHPLDRPVWNCLTTRQAALAEGAARAWRIDPGYGPFAAAAEASDEGRAALAALLPDTGEMWIVENQEWPVPPGARLVRRARLAQMVAGEIRGDADPALNIVALGDANSGEMAALAAATEPGPWGPKTHRYGQFYGIRDDGRLVAMAGERMRPEGFAEVSGVCTYPDYRGRGYAGALMRRVMTGLLARGDTPFLHAYAGNSGAIALYESLGFALRREMAMMVLVKA